MPFHPFYNITTGGWVGGGGLKVRNPSLSHPFFLAPISKHLAYPIATVSCHPLMPFSQGVLADTKHARELFCNACEPSQYIAAQKCSHIIIFLYNFYLPHDLKLLLQFYWFCTQCSHCRNSPLQHLHWQAAMKRGATYYFKSFVFSN